MAATWTVSTMERTLTDGALSDVVTTLHWQVTDSEAAQATTADAAPALAE